MYCHCSFALSLTPMDRVMDLYLLLQHRVYFALALGSLYLLTQTANSEWKANYVCIALQHTLIHHAVQPNNYDVRVELSVVML